MSRAAAGSDRALFWTFAAAAFAVACAGLAARAVERMAGAYQTQRDAYAIVRVLAPEGAAGMSAAQSALAHAPHVVGAAPMTARRAAALLEQWGGAPLPQNSGENGDMPPLRLIEIDLAPASPQADVGGDIEAALAQGGVTAEVIEPPGGISGGGLALGVSTLAMWAAGLFTLVIGLIISLAARGLVQRRADYVTVLADLGATANEAGQRVANVAAVMGMRAGFIGAGAAALTGIVAVLSLAPGATLARLPHMIRLLDLAPLLIAPLIAAAAAGMGARAGAESVHAQAARLA